MQIEQKLRKIEDLFLQIVTIWRKKLYVKKFFPENTKRSPHFQYKNRQLAISEY